MPYLGARLRAIYEWIESAQAIQSYQEIWDCCCDHGYLGIKILAQELCEQVYFVDQARHLIDDLQQRLKVYPADRYQAFTADAGQLQLAPDKRPLIIIAGIGGELSIDIIHQILHNHQGHSLDFLFCPTTTQFDLREYLAEKPFELLHETMVTEKGRDYEIICARWNSPQPHPQPVSKTGEHWDLNDAVHHRYLSKLIRHYQRRTLGENAREARRVLTIYQTLWQQLDTAS